MQKITFTLLFTLCTIFGIQAQQHVTCDGTRYVSDVFSNVDITTDVVFGAGTTIGGNSRTLMMDIYEPQGDMATQRPVVMLAFGGSFIAGSRQDMDGLCRYYAQKGYVAVTIDYRLFDIFTIPNTTQMTDVVIKAISDMKAAVRYLREDAATANLYKIDPDKIFVGGVSAGGIVASHVAYVDSTDTIDPAVMTAINANGGWTGNSSTNTQYSSGVQGVLNFSGALADAAYISAGEAPLFSAHDDGDGTVPYNGANAVVFNIPIIYMEGSGVMHPRATAQGVTNMLITIPNSTGHVSYFQSNAAQWQDSVQQSSCQFLHDNILCPMSTSTATIESQVVTSTIYPNPSSSDMTIDLEYVPSAYTVTVYDNMGRRVHQATGLNNTVYRLERNNLTAGMYHVDIQFKNQAYQPIRSKVVFN